MRLKQKVIYYFIFFSILGVAIYFIESYVRQQRIQEIVYMVQDAQEGLGYRFDVPSVSNDELKSHQQIIAFPSNEIVNQCFKPSLQNLVSSCWLFATTIQKRFKNKDDTSSDRQIDSDRLSGAVEIQKNDTTTIKLKYLRGGIVGEYVETIHNGFNSCVLTFFDREKPKHIFIAPTAGGLGFDIQFYENGSIQYLYTFTLHGLLGPAVIWKDDGSLKEERFFERPYPAQLKLD